MIRSHKSIIVPIIIISEKSCIKDISGKNHWNNICIWSPLICENSIFHQSINYLITKLVQNRLYATFFYKTNLWAFIFFIKWICGHSFSSSYEFMSIFFWKLVTSANSKGYIFLLLKIIYIRSQHRPHNYFFNTFLGKFKTSNIIPVHMRAVVHNLGSKITINTSFFF